VKEGSFCAGEIEGERAHEPLRGGFGVFSRREPPAAEVEDSVAHFGGEVSVALSRAPVVVERFIQFERFGVFLVALILFREEEFRIDPIPQCEMLAEVEAVVELFQLFVFCDGLAGLAREETIEDVFGGRGGARGVRAIFCGGLGFLASVSDAASAIIDGSFVAVGKDAVGLEEVLYLLVGPLLPAGVAIGVIFFDQRAKRPTYVVVGGIVVDAKGFVMIGHCAEIHSEAQGCK